MQNQTRTNPLNPQPSSPLQTEVLTTNLSSPLVNTTLATGRASSSNSQTLLIQPAAVEENGLRGEYFDNIDFTNPQLTRTDSTVNFNWGSGSPDPTIGADTFSVRWTGRVRPETTGSYQFFTTTDDGVQLLINGQVVIDRFRDQAATEVASTPINLVAGQDYNIQLNYYENRGAAVARLQWERPNGAGRVKEVIPQSRLFTPLASPPVTTGTGTGLRGTYYNNSNFTDQVLSRTDATVNFNWGTGSPAANIAADTFSVQWRGYVQPLYSETYRFYTTTDDGVRLRVNGQTVIDQFRNQSPTEVISTPITLVAGEKYTIEMDYYENTGGAVARLGWLSNSQIKQIIAQSQLYAENVLPTAIANTTNISTGGSGTYTFTVTYSDNVGINTSTIDSTDILVTGPNSFSQIATLVSVNDATNGTPRTATYRINAPGGTWDTGDNGSYTVTLRPNQIRDTSGNEAATASLGNFQVNISAPATGNGLRAEYYNNLDFTGLVLTRVDPTINFNFGSGSPAPGVDGDTFSIRWTGQVEAQFSEDYIFYTNSDDGIRVRINGQTVIDRFVDQPATEVASAPIRLVAGQKYDIVVEYYDNTLDAIAQLSWSSISQAKQIIPQTRLFSATPPIPSLSATNLSQTGQSTYTFTVAYSDDTAVDVASIDSSDIRVTGPNGFSQLAELVSVSNSANGTPRIATYRITKPGTNATWSLADNGSYTVTLQPNQVRDTDGNFSTGGTIGRFLIDIGGTGTGLKGDYYNNINFTDLALTRTDATINFDWGAGSPASAIAPDTFSVVWTGDIEAKYNELYTFYSTTDDGVRVFINNQIVIDSFIDQASTERQGTISLEAGRKYAIRVEYFENGGLANARLEWSSATQTRQVVPSSQLYPFVVPPLIGLGAVPTDVTETDGFARIEIVRSGEDLNQSSTVRYLTSSGTATSGVDFTSTSGTATFAPNQTSVFVDVPIRDDSDLESNETFTFAVDQATNATLAPRRTATITILDDETTDLTIQDVRVDENAGEAVVTVKRGRTLTSASVNYATQNGTAIAGSDYTTTNGVLNFAAGAREATVRIPIVNNTLGEANETFSLVFSNPTGATLGTKTSSIITIVDDDPGNIRRQAVVTGLTRPTSFDWAPITGSSSDRFLLVAQQDGIVRVSRNNVLQQEVFIDLSTEVNGTRDRGLLGIAVHPDFNNTPYVYLLYTYDPPQVFDNINPNTTLDGPDGNGNRPSRLLRVTAEYIRDAGGNIIGLRASQAANSREVILGKNSTWQNTNRPDGNSTDVVSIGGSEFVDFNAPNNFGPSGIVDQNGNLFETIGDYYENLDRAVNIQDYLATDSESHSIGYLAFGPDGNLYVSNGDGTSYNRADPRSIRVQDPNNLSGKLLRIDPITGQGVAGNPFFNASSPNSNASKVFSLGLRNPFRFTFDADGKPYIGDVGWKTAEEVNSGGAGSNFGWPYYEGPRRQDEYNRVLRYTYTNAQGETITVQPVQDFYDNFGDGAVVAPVYSYRESSQNSVVVGDFYTANRLPSIYQGQLFVGDASQGRIDSIRLDSQGRFQSIQSFQSNSAGNNVGIPVQITTGPDGYLYYVDLGFTTGGGGVYRYELNIV